MLRDSLLPTIYPSYAWRIVRSSAILWLLVRLALLVVAKALRLTFGASMIVMAVPVFLWWLDGRRLNEHLYHRNLGTPVSLGVVISASTTCVLEVGARMGLRSVLG
jgi:hypothetical protein